jgi:hypothetical protein
VTDQLHVILRRFDEPDEVRTFEKGRFELVCIHGMTIDRATYEPGWRWSEHVGTAAGQKSCRFEHIGMIVSGRATAAMDDASSRWAGRHLLHRTGPRQLGRRQLALRFAALPRR